MRAQEVHLGYGALILAALYVVGNVGYRLWSARPVEATPSVVAQIDLGRTTVETCTACHYLDQRTNFVGPHLVGLLDRPVASVDDYEYSRAARGQHSSSWTPERLVKFLQNPQAMVPGTKMALSGWSKEEAEAVVAYLQSKE